MQTTQNPCKEYQELIEKEQLANNDRLPISIYHQAGQRTDKHVHNCETCKNYFLGLNKK